MGLYDRPYYQDEERSNLPPSLAAQSFAVVLIVINVAVFFADFIFGGEGFALRTAMEVTPQTIVKPWLWWQFVTYGFAHGNMNHILFNMIGLFFFGRIVEQRLGKFEFLRFYLVAIILGGIVWSLRANLTDSLAPGVIGASGGVVAVTMLFIFWYPQTEIYLMMVLPVKAWVVGVMMIAGNLFGMGSETTAFDVHLVGIAFASAYYYFHWNLGQLSPAALTKLTKRNTRLKLHDPDRQSRQELRDADEAERILQKIHEHGEASLTNAERKVLERHSRRLRDRR
ncbi:Rhomboid protease GlpG [Rosistilla carotiformis]|uniref:Rhomboid protease GlpG n=1 Tax=Rosistilla carotiformis TaxID=2528017 RepID=A0A518JZY1_9BACT|nr:rhomboid family intramembrane serine protease [Rosistilla carotiformis]QDV71100.1 Rhomboid protease GlpG [Rosistilla carotiformis]